MKVIRIECDNPTCQQVGVPEHVTQRKTLPPYAWFRSDTLCMGPGPRVTVDVCSLECLGPAVVEAFDEAHRKEYGEEMGGMGG